MKYYMNKNQKLIKIDRLIKIGSKDQNQMNESKVIFADYQINTEQHVKRYIDMSTYQELDQLINRN